jgi:3-deoxy-D-manno-octulosonate 8-phosphate phosphatase (KDO 8-P phosphatase)
MGLESIKLIVLDVDGTMTDGAIYIGSNQEEIKKFNVKDGAGISLAQSAGIEFMLLTGRSSGCVEKRAEELRIKHVAQGVHNKVEYLREFCTRNNLLVENVAYIGDDLNDLPAMRYAGISACPSDAVEEVQNYCDFVLPRKGGAGVVRVFIEMVLKEKGLWKQAISNLFPQ